MGIGRFMVGRALVVAIAVATAGCTTLPTATDGATAECRAFYADLDRRIDRAGVRDEGARRITGYPYLRVDRLLASFANEADTDAGFAAWVSRLRALDQDARAAELHNLDRAAAADAHARSARCGAQLAAVELATPAQRAHLRERVHVPDDYSVVARGLGFYPFAVPFLNQGIAGYHDEVREDYARPLAELGSPGPLVVWSPAVSSAAAAVPAPPPTDALGIPQFTEAQWRQLAEQHAPTWWIEEGGAYDRPGALRYRADGRVDVDAGQPVVYFRGDTTRFGGQVLPTLSYIVWFPERPPQKSFDPYAGVLDGLIWRVVLDARGEPLVYDTIHPCGCYRYTFPAQPLQRLDHGGYWQEPALFPQDEVPAGGRLALRIQSQTHYLRRVVPEAVLSGDRRSYSLRPYADLLTLDDGRGGTRSLFARDGIVDGTERTERWWLWITGVFEPGAMRQWGRHATSFVGRSHFDDARFLEQTFAVPDWAR